MYIYKEKEIKSPIYIHFLCGNKYKKYNNSDKRKVLKEYIDSLENNYSIILEEFFKIHEYEDIGLKDLEEVELMISNFARSIIIFQETVSTAAEVALFGSKEKLRNKVFVTYAPFDIVKTDQVGTFIRSAYFAENKVKKFEYSFKRKHRIKARGEVKFYDTLFYNNKLDGIFIEELNDFWKQIPNRYDITFRKKYPTTKSLNYYSIVNNSAEIIIDYDLVFSMVMCILINNKYIKDKRNEEKIVSNICKFIKELLINTICFKEKVNISNGNIKMNDKEDINTPVRFLISLLLRMDLISFNNNNISISNDFKQHFAIYKDLIEYIEDKNFFEGCDIYEK